MINKDEIQELLHSTETYRVERTTSTGDIDKFQEAICAFANDLSSSRMKGYLILRAYDNGGKVGGKVGGKNGGDNVPSLSPALSPVLSQVVTSLSQACPKLAASHYSYATAILIALCKEPQSLKELMEKTKEKNRGRIKDNVLQNLCESGLVEPTIKDVPNGPKQKYALTDEGREKLQAIS